MRLFVRLLAMAVLLACLVGCAHGTRTASEELAALLGENIRLPKGRLYTSEAKDYEGGLVLDGPLLRTLYARDDGRCEYEGHVESGAVFLGTEGEGYTEIGLFLCYGSADSRLLAEMCRRRAKLLAEAGVPSAGDVLISVRGRWVVYLLTSDRALRDALAERLT